MRRLVSVLILLGIMHQAKAQTWEDSLMKTMSLDEKIGQLFMVAAYSNKDDSHTQYIENLIKQYHIGGLIFFQGSVGKQVYLTNYYQNITRYPLFIGQDAEWGINMRIKEVPKYPYSMTLGASRSNALAYETGRAMGMEMKRMGVHISFAPVADVNNNPNNPIIGFRSFGDDKENVSQKALAVVHGLQSERIIACAKHFPGHGNTGTDSHLDLPVLNQTRKDLDSIELYPFRNLVNGGVMSAMVGHIHIPSIDNTPNLPASLSPKLVKNILQYEMNFQGLVFTDALNMKGVSKYFANGDAEVKALLAGNDILLYPNDVATAVKAIKRAIRDSVLSENDIDQKVKKILYYKRWVHLDTQRFVNTGDVLNELKLIHQESGVMEMAAEKCISLVHNGYGFIPISDSLSYLHISIGELGTNEFFESLNVHKNVTRLNVSKTASVSTAVSVKSKAKNYDRVIVSFHNPSIWNAKSYGYGDAMIRMAKELAYEENAALVLFCNPYLTRFFSKAKTIIVAFEDEKVFRQEAALMMLGQKEMRGQLPFKPKNVEMDHWLPLSYFESSGIKADEAQLSGLDTNKLLRIDYLLNEITASSAAPGGQVLIAKGGRVVYEKSFGKYTYTSTQLVTPHTLYDLASITKVFASGLMSMKLYDLGLLTLDTPIHVYIPELVGKPLGRVKIEDLMLHQAGLPAWIPFYKETLSHFDQIYHTTQSGAYQIEVAQNMYMDTSYLDSMYQQIYSIKPERYGKYKYSDLSLILLKKALENIAGQSLDEYVRQNFYIPLGLEHTGFNMHRSFPRDSFAPSEQDNYFRNQALQGHVHDMAAAMFGGVSGHAGLFSNTQDMLILSEMLRNGGRYNQVDYLNPATIQLFSCKVGKNSRRGLLFDKPEGRDDRPSPTSESCPIASFGHTGFTGTCVWIDPVNDIVYIFLSNRTYPSMENRRLIRGNYRDKIQETIYNSLKP